MHTPPPDIATIHKGFLAPEEASILCKDLSSHTPIKEKDEIQLFDGNKLLTNTGKCMYVDNELVDGKNFELHHGRRVVWPERLLRLRDRIEALLKMEFSVCVGLYYPGGEHWVDYHTDFRAFGSTRIIPSISLGSTRKFSLRNKQDHHRQFEIPMAHGDLVIMRENCQDNYDHALLQDESIKQPRINLTFRPFDWSKVNRQEAIRY